ncbi:MAG: hypothetical protein Q4D80_02020 [Pseudomonadota bacterium]|nr:hypothetical protein [Pseudomonadota bacterium]
MKKTRLIWPDNVVVDRILSGKLFYLSGVYDQRRLVKAKLFEQKLSVTPDVKDDEPVLVKEVSLIHTPLLFAMSGGHRWLLYSEQEVEGLKLECEQGVFGRLKKVERVRYQAVYNYTLHEYKRHKMQNTGEFFAFKSWQSLQIEYFSDNRMKTFVPIYLMKEEKFIEDMNGYPRCSDGSKPRLLGCDVFDKGHFNVFLPAENLPKELSAYFNH